MELRVEAEVRKTEDQAKVGEAIKKLFPKLKLERVGDSLIGKSEDQEVLDDFHNLLRTQHIRDSARAVMYRNRKGEQVKFMLNKQAAWVGKVNFTDGESPLGPIEVTISARDIEKMINWLAPPTKDGKPIKGDRTSW